MAGVSRPVSGSLWSGLAVGRVLLVQLYPREAPLPDDPAMNCIIHGYARASGLWLETLKRVYASLGDQEAVFLEKFVKMGDTSS